MSLPSTYIKRNTIRDKNTLCLDDQIVKDMVSRVLKRKISSSELEKLTEVHRDDEGKKIKITLMGGHTISCEQKNGAYSAYNYELVSIISHFKNQKLHDTPAINDKNHNQTSEGPARVEVRHDGYTWVSSEYHYKNGLLNNPENKDFAVYTSDHAFNAYPTSAHSFIDGVNRGRVPEKDPSSEFYDCHKKRLVKREFRDATGLLNRSPTLGPTIEKYDDEGAKSDIFYIDGFEIVEPINDEKNSPFEISAKRWEGSVPPPSICIARAKSSIKI